MTVVEIFNSVAGFSGLIIGVTSFITMRSNIKKNNGDASESIANAANTLIEPMENRLKDLEENRIENQNTINDLQELIQNAILQNNHLRNQVVLLEGLNLRLVTAIMENLRLRRIQASDLMTCKACFDADGRLEETSRKIQSEFPERIRSAPLLIKSKKKGSVR